MGHADGPSGCVDGVVVKPAQEHPVLHIGASLRVPRDHVVHLAPRGGDPAARNNAAAVTGGDRPPLRRAEEPFLHAEVQHANDSCPNPASARHATFAADPIRPPSTRRPTTSSAAIDWSCRGSRVAWQEGQEDAPVPEGRQEEGRHIVELLQAELNGIAEVRPEFMG